MNLQESLAVALFCMTTVFALLASFFLIVNLLSFIVRMIQKRVSIKQANQNAKVNNAVSANTASLTPITNGSGGTLQLVKVDEPTAAMIMAIISDESGIPLSELCFKSIKLISDHK